MATEYTLDTGDKVTPEDKGGPRVGIGCKATARRSTDGAIGIEVMRGDGGSPEAFTVTVRTKWFGPFVASELATLELGCMDLPMPDFTPRTYRMRVVLDGIGDLAVATAFIATEPYAPSGSLP